ncbi:FecCD family ABC transporter permease [Oceanibaculum sp.]|uniref:FecCD family ABC transporter permease n=1 Tax=Oceanibaculum sp. TaxID=1903597 RepID=UPI0025859F55|nr:iron ABC transporter permease [Oceanibaculum sp.]MCH2393144.1 iron ABC transporter permease [Oceanibaculum sp.]
MTAETRHGAAAGARSWLMPGALLALLVLLILLALSVGQYPVTPGQLFDLIVAGLTGRPSAVPETVQPVIWQVRLPRVAGALLVGAALAAAGAAYQGLFRNPLVSPDILGVSAGSGLGAVLGIFLSLPVIGIQLSAFVFGIAAVTLVYLIAASVRGREPVLVLVLAGVVLGTLAGAVISLLKVLADPYDQLPAITFWLLGSLATLNPGDVLAAAPLVLLGLAPLYLLRWRMNLMALGDEEAKTLGIDAARLRLLFIAAATLMTAAVVSISGIVGWVGLVMPHIARMLVGPNFERLLPASLLLGAGYLLIVDTLARTLTVTEVPLGILTAFLGAPFFLWLLARGRHGWQ